MSTRMKTSSLYEELKKICTKSSVESVMTFMQVNGTVKSEGKGIVRVEANWKETLQGHMERPKVGDIVFTFGRGTHLVTDTNPKMQGIELDSDKYFTGYKLTPGPDGAYRLSPIGGASNLETADTMRLRAGHFNMPAVKKLVDRKEKISKDLDEVIHEISEIKEGKE